MLRIRYDLILCDTSGRYLRELCQYHVGGQLKIAPEHIALPVTRLMGKPGRAEYEKFVQRFNGENKKLGKKQYLIPYFIAAHPGNGLNESIELAEFIRDHMQYYPEQVQNFTPTPMTISTSMYYTGLNPMNGKQVYVPESTWERQAQRALLQYRNRANHRIAREALAKCGRTELIGSSPLALIKEKSPITSPTTELSRRRKQSGKKRKNK